MLKYIFLCALFEAQLTRQICEASKAGDIKAVRSALRRGAPINGTGPQVRDDLSLYFATTISPFLFGFFSSCVVSPRLVYVPGM